MSENLPQRSFDATLAAISEANSSDPNIVVLDGEQLPLALAQGQRAAEWVRQLAGAPSDELVIAAQAHHLRRWEVPRSSYPEGRPGYIQWRSEQKVRHAADVAEIMDSCGYSTETIERVQKLTLRGDLAADDEMQTLEDAACLVFIETQLGDMTKRLDHDHMIRVIRKTINKMSPAGITAVQQVIIGDTERSLLEEALLG